VSSGQFRDEAHILIRFFRAQLVIDMRDRQYDPQLASQLEQKRKQSDRIRPTRNRRPHAVSRVN